jgi:hypothetical protein
VFGLVLCWLNWDFFLLGCLGVPFGFWDFDPCGFCCFIFVGWLWLFLCILHVYLEAPLRFFNKIFLIY